MKRLLLSLLVVLLSFGFVACGSTPAENNSNNPGETLFNKDSKGLVIGGYDAVAYFKDSKAVKGDAQHKLEWSGATWHFSSAANRDEFKANPEKYAPQYGSYCAWAMARNEKANIDPNSWKIVDGKLYLNYDKKIQGLWEADIPGFIKKADGFWPTHSSKK